MKNFSVIITLFLCVLNLSAQTPSPTMTSSGDRENSSSTEPVPTVSPPPTEVKSNATTPATTTGTNEKPAVETRSSIYVGKNAAARIPRFETAPVIDGQLNDAVWQRAAVFGDFPQIQPGDNVAPSAPTEVMIGYDAKNLYIAFRVKQDRDKIRATVARRDNIFNDDYVGVYLDTFLLITLGADGLRPRARRAVQSGTGQPAFHRIVGALPADDRLSNAA